MNKQKYPDFRAFAWGIFLYSGSSYGGDEAYLTLMREDHFLDDLRFRPKSVKLDQISKHLIRFLNGWRCRVEDSEEMAGQIRDAIGDALPLLNSLQSTSLRKIDLNEQKGEIAEITKLLGVKGFGPTCISKTLHVLNPALFLPWDQPMRDWFWEAQRSMWYADWLEYSQGIARHIDEDFERWQSKLSPEDYLSRKMKCELPKSLPKCIDEYLWIRITKQATLPPSWYPDMDAPT
jgi:hypothetical protein